MEAKEYKLQEVLTDSRIYEIPNYQRPYSWSERQVDDLVNDLWDAFDENESEYFMGSLITIQKGIDPLFEIVDGQQRLTTLNLILATLRDLISDQAVKQDLENRIRPRNVYTGEAEKPRLIVRSKDRDFFNLFVLQGKRDFDTSNISETQRRMLANSESIQSLFKDKDQAQLKLFANYLLKKVFVVFVRTDSFDSAYRLFNVLNARGLPLTTADLLKNKLFDSAEDSDGRDSVHRVWDSLEERIGLPELDIFLSHYRTSIFGNKQQQSLFKEYEDYLKRPDVKTIDFCSSLLTSATNYEKVTKNTFGDVRERRLIDSLQRVSHDEWIPPLLAFLNIGVQGLSQVDFISLLERITIQNWVRRLGRGKRVTVYFRIINDINQKNSADDIVNNIEKFANNDEFVSFISGDVYGMDYAKAVLLRIEKEIVDDSVVKEFTGLISLEHVLPQSLSDPYWISRFIPEQHKLLVHKLGNLTLLSGKKNSAAQNYDFEKKKKVYLERGRKVSFDLTQDVCKESEWTEGVIKKRQEELVKKAQEIWTI
ncbi:MAG: DUF262 domain-containing HNH endonuclease family protein [Pyrinomonadaceae bacterium]